MHSPKLAPVAAPDEAVAATRALADDLRSRTREARLALAWHRAESQRLRLLVDFLARPIHAHGGAEPDPDIITAYNLAVEAALLGIRRAATGSS